MIGGSLLSRLSLDMVIKVVLIQERLSATGSAVNRFRESDPGGTSANHHIGIALGHDSKKAGVSRRLSFAF